MKLTKLLGALAISGAFTAQSWASIIISWDVTGDSSPATLTADSVVDPNLSTTSGLNTLTRVGLGANAGSNSFNSNGWNFTDTFNEANDYISFKISATTGYSLSVTKLGYAINGSNTAPNTVRWGYSTDGGTTFTLQTPQTLTFSLPGSLVEWDFADFTVNSGVDLEFRMWVYGSVAVNGGTSTAAGAARIGNIAGDDLVVFGSVIPEPSTAAIVALGGLGTVLLRRKLRKTA